MQKEKSNITGYLKRNLKNAHLTLDFEILTSEDDGPKKAFTVADKFMEQVGKIGEKIEIGYYDTYKGFLEINHNLDGYYDFEVVEISSTRLKASQKGTAKAAATPPTNRSWPLSFWP